MINSVLDKTDLGILDILQRDSRTFYKDIALELHKSVTAIHTRVRRLETEGYIKRYTVILDHKKAGRGLIAYTQVWIEKHSQESMIAFQSEVIKLREVMECSQMTGAFDFLLRIAIRDMDEYNALYNEKLLKLPCVDNMQSFFVMSTVKNETAYLLG